jgi:hypothetical protein
MLTFSKIEQLMRDILGIIAFKVNFFVLFTFVINNKTGVSLFN